MQRRSVSALYGTIQRQEGTDALPHHLMWHSEARSGNPAVPGRITGKPPAKSQLLPEIATAPSGPRNDKSGGIAPMNLYRSYCQPAWRSLSAATDASGLYVFSAAGTGRLCLPEIATSAFGLLAMTNL